MYGGLMHQLLGNAAHIDAGTAQPPLGLGWRLLHIVDYYGLETVRGRLEGSSQAPRPAPDDS